MCPILTSALNGLEPAPEVFTFWFACFGLGAGPLGRVAAFNGRLP